MTDFELLSNRLLTMEKRFRWMKRVAIAGCIMMAAGAVMAQFGPQDLNQLDPLRNLRRPDPDQPDQATAPRTPVEAEVRSHAFVLVDAKGKERASLVTDAAGSVFLVMFDAAGKTRANLSVSNDGPSLVFYDPSGQPRTIVGSTTLVGSHVSENGIVEKAPSSSMVLFDRMGKLLFRTP